MVAVGVRNRVSVVVPTRDRRALLAETLASLRRQSHADWEAVVVDDGSRDGTPEHVRRWAAEDGRIRLLCREAGLPGGNHCRNLGLAASTGEFVVFLDDDDLLSPGCLAARVAAMQAFPALDFAAFSHERFHTRPGDLEEVVEVVPGRDDIERLLRCDIPWQTAGPIWRRGALGGARSWDERLVCWQDWDFYLRVLIGGARYRCFPFHSRYFYRVARPAGSSISNQPQAPERLRSQELAASSAFALLARVGGLTPHRRRLLAWQMLRIAEQWHVLGQPTEALALWDRCLTSGLVGRVAHLEGAALLHARPLRPARGVLRRFLMLRWPT